MSDTYAAQPIVSGIWKFAPSVTPERLVAVARGWSIGENGDRYIDLHVRKCSKLSYGIGFKYVLDSEEPPKRAHAKFFHKMTGQLKRMFGDEFVVWDVSSPTWVIK